MYNILLHCKVTNVCHITRQYCPIGFKKLRSSTKNSTVKKSIIKHLIVIEKRVRDKKFSRWNGKYCCTINLIVLPINCSKSTRVLTIIDFSINWNINIINDLTPPNWVLIIEYLKWLLTIFERKFNSTPLTVCLNNGLVYVDWKRSICMGQY